eukprot:Hpha_TRINITY_DN1312_c0_g1::TRINITY_DN1312_c0_g1_i1::g.93411::m.93411
MRVATAQFSCDKIGLKEKLMKLSLTPIREREDKDQAQFSPTHFSVDLFAPHCTTDQVVKAVDDTDLTSPQIDLVRKPSFEDRCKDRGETNSSPREEASQMLDMLEALMKLNQPGEDELSPEEWDDLGITWSVPIDGGVTDIIPHGHEVNVPLRDKDAYCKMASEELEMFLKKAEL